MAKEALTQREIEELRRKLAAMSVTGVKDFYRSAYFQCELSNHKLPAATAIQKLAQAWREMRKIQR